MKHTFTLYNGVKIPAIGYGTYRATDSTDGLGAITEAIRIGYRLIDTAAMYRNEEIVGQAIRNSGIGRREIFLTTKVANQDRGFDSTLRAFDKSLDRLHTDYVDLYLIHWPASEGTAPGQWQAINASTWKAMERLMTEGRCRAIGVSNFMPEHLEALSSTATIAPMVNQIEIHPGMNQKVCCDYCRKHGIAVEAWSPLGRTRVLDHELLKKLAQSHGKTPAQICLRWEIQSGIIPLPKSVSPERMLQNLEVFDFTLSTEEMDSINAMEPFGMSGLNPDNITF